jgi:hypothetical protein
MAPVHEKPTAVPSISELQKVENRNPQVFLL